MATSGDDLVANDYRDPNFLFDISTGAGDDYIWTHLRSDLTETIGPVYFTIDGGPGFDIFKIPGGWLAGFVVT